MNNAREIIRNRIEKRLQKIDWSQLFSGFETNFWIAGSCLNKDTPNDYDIFNLHVSSLVPLNQTKPVHTSKNAQTYNIDGKTIQICAYTKPTLLELIESFDFAHVQVGAEVKVVREGAGCKVIVTNLTVTDAYLDAMITGESHYVGSAYPLSSLFRVSKYKDRGFLGNHRLDMVRALTNVIERGFNGYDDFKDQLDAIDMAYISDSAELIRLFNALNREVK
jgi:hypothetical protein